MAPKKTSPKKPPRKKTTSKPASKKTPSKKKPSARPSAILSPEILPAETSVTAKNLTSKKKKKPLASIGFDEFHDAEIVDERETEERDEDEAPGTDDDETGFDPSDESDIEKSSPSSTDLVVADGTTIDRELSSAGQAISPTDPLRRYLDEVRRYSLLSPEEEIALATKLHASGDLEAAKRLVQANLRLVVKIAFEYKSVYANVMDLIQEGNIGLMKAVSKYDPTKGARLGYYSSWWIRSYILKYLLDNFRLVRVGTTAA